MPDLFEIIRQTDLLPMIQQHPLLIGKIADPIELLQLTAINCFKQSTILADIKVLSKRSQLLAVQKWPSALHFIKCPTKDIEFHAVRSYAEAIQYVTMPSRKLQMIAVSAWPGAIQFISIPCEEAEMLAWTKQKCHIDKPCSKVKKLVAEQKEIEKKSKEVKHSRKLLQLDANLKEKKETSKNWRRFNANDRKRLTF